MIEIKGAWAEFSCSSQGVEYAENHFTKDVEEIKERIYLNRDSFVRGQIRYVVDGEFVDTKFTDCGAMFFELF